MKKLAYQFSFILLFFLMGGTSVNAQILLKEISLKQQIENSTLVVEGEVISKKSFWDADHKNIFTRNTIRIYKVFKGEAITTIDVITSGGTVAFMAQIVSPSLKLRNGDIGVFTLNDINISLSSDDKSVNKQFKTYSSLQGFYKYNIIKDVVVNPFNKKQGIASSFYNEIFSYTKIKYIEMNSFNVDNKRLAFSKNESVLAPGAIEFSPTTSSAGTKSVLTITGTGFGGTQGKIGFSNGDDGGATYVDALDSQVLTWADALITVEIPSEAGKGKIRVTHNDTSSAVSVDELSITHSEINAVTDFLTIGTEYAYQTQHIDADGSGGYVLQMQTDFNANTAAKSSFLRALDTWRCESGINFTIGAVTTTDVVGVDGVFVVRFDNVGELGVGVLGECSYFLSGCGNTGVPSSGRVYVSELDIVFDDAENWNFSTALPDLSQIDFESVALHELGHGHQLGHVINTDAVMHYAISPSDYERTLSPNDIIGANDIQTRSTTTPVCGELVMTNHPCSLSVEDEELKDAISIYPNPSKGSFNIKNTSLINLEKVVIYDISGRLISEYNMTNSSRIKTINLVGVSKGMYFINIQSERGIITKKLVLE
jgi:hypothetical protein